MDGWRYVLACIAVPFAIGSFMYGAIEVWERYRLRKKREELPHIDYLL